MKKIFDNFINNNFIVFSVDIAQKKKKDSWKKEIKFQKNWSKFTLKTAKYIPSYNSMAIITGKINGIFVLDIDNVKQWQELLQKHNKKEPPTVKVQTGSGGIHYYFKYTDNLDLITTTDHVIEDYDIDIRSNGGCTILPPSTYFNNNVSKDVEYKWIYNIFDYDMIEVPEWIYNLLIKKPLHIDESEKVSSDLIKVSKDVEIIEKDVMDYSDDDIDVLLYMLNKHRYENYTEWVNVGMCLYNINKNYKYIWKNWSKQCAKYDEVTCDEKWKSFQKDKDKKLTIASLLFWCKQDNKDKYDEFINKKKINNIIVSKFPEKNLILGKTTKVSKMCSHIDLNNKECFIYGDSHDENPSMYIEMIQNLLSIKCKHPCCHSKIYPCEHIIVSQKEMNVFVNSGNITINVNNGTNEEELIEFKKIKIFDNDELNELVFNSLNGDSSQLAEIIYYYYSEDFNYGENNEWYVFTNHKWINVGNKNTKLRYYICPTLKEVYTQLLNYYKDNNADKQKIKLLKNVIKTFGGTMQKNNIMTELIDIFTEKKNPKRDFLKKMDKNNYLIGFENGVYDLNTFTFRDGKPDDYITLSVEYNYTDTYSEKYKDLLQFLEDIQPNKEEREYMITYLSISLVGNLLELFTILTGCGRNGKSKLIELIKLTFGNYFASVSSQMFTRQRPDANSPDPGLLNLMNKRIVIASEPEKNNKLNSGFIKFITGRDSTTLRNCHSNDMINFTANFSTLLICNDIPDCDDMDNAFSKRLRCIHFPTEFVNDPVESNQKKIDVNINKNFEYWKMDFMLLLIEHFKIYSKTHELKATENIFKWTDKYKGETDIFLQFLQECIQPSETHLHTMQLYQGFKNWFKMNNPQKNIPDNRTFIKAIKKYYTICDNVRIGGKVSCGIKNISFTNEMEF
jgi:P4 family phage/plasmid primase-like protien